MEVSVNSTQRSIKLIYNEKGNGLCANSATLREKEGVGKFRELKEIGIIRIMGLRRRALFLLYQFLLNTIIPISFVSSEYQDF
jgi:hypothetical protein